MYLARQLGRGQPQRLPILQPGVCGLVHEPVQTVSDRVPSGFVLPGVVEHMSSVHQQLQARSYLGQTHVVHPKGPALDVLVGVLGHPQSQPGPRE